MTVPDRKSVVLLLAVLTTSPSAHAFGGVGDVTFDPAVHSQLVSMFELMKKSLDSINSQLDTMRAIKDTALEAQKTYETIKNADLDDVARALLPAAYMAANSAGVDLSATERRLDELKSRDPKNAALYDAQKRQLVNLKTVQSLQDTSAKNVTKAAIDLNERESSQVTAQSTATLAALAAAEEQRKTQEEAARAGTVADEKRFVSGTTNIYRAMGTK